MDEPYMKAMLIQILRNQLFDMKDCCKEGLYSDLHEAYVQMQQTKELLSVVDPLENS